MSTSLPLNSRFIEFEIGDTNGGIAGEDDNDNAPKRFRSKDVISISSQPSASIKRVGFTPSIIFRFHKEDGTYIGTEYTDEAKKMRIILANVNGNNNVDLRNLQECILTYNSLDYKCTKYNLAASVDNLPTNVANITWAEIGDSFVEPDNNNGNGYGKIIREKLGIIQANHHAAGFSGYSWVTFYLYAILENDPKLNVCRDKNGKRMECLYTVYVPFLPQHYKDRVRKDSIWEEEQKHCFVEWESPSRFMDGNPRTIQNYIDERLVYDPSLLGNKEQVRGFYKVKINSYGEPFSSKTLPPQKCLRLFS